MAHVIFKNVDLKIPIYNKRLFSLKWGAEFSQNLVGTKKSKKNGKFFSNILNNISFGS